MRLTIITGISTLGLAGVAAAYAPPAVPPQAGYFDRQVRPILARRCFGCHSAQAGRPQGGLRLDHAAGWLQGGATGPALKAGSPDASLLMKAVRHEAGVSPMPPSGKLPESEVAILAEWIRRGAPGPSGSAAAGPAASAPHWAFQPLKRPPVPRVKNAAWCRTPIDAFVLAKLEAKGLTPSPEADPRTLIRRAYFDLTGLPPTPAEVEAFIRECAREAERGVRERVGVTVRSDPRSPNAEHRTPAPAGAYTRLIDRLLGSPRYGERWGRHWLDVVHYGDTHGYDKDKRRVNAWPYRDYVIRSLNADKPYSRFIREQVAGDVLYPNDPDGAVATGFVASGPWDFVGQVELREGTVEKEKTRVLDRDDMVANTLSTFNSVTIHCARCHDHKFDPISQKEYYRLQAVFAGVERGDRPFSDPSTQTRRMALEAERQELTKARDTLQQRLAALTSPELKTLDDSLKRLQLQLGGAPLPAGEPGSPTNGYHSGIEKQPDVEKWVQLDLGRPLPIEEVRLFPARPTDFPDTPGFGFPARFRVAVSDDPTFATAELVLDRSAAEFPNPGSEPLLIRPERRTARYVRVTATRLWPRTGDYVFALAEIQVVSGGRNAAAGAAVTALDSIEGGRWARKNLTDGYDSRSRMPDPSDPKVAAALRDRFEWQEEIRRLEQARRDTLERLIDPESRQSRVRVTARLEAVARELAALPPPAQVYGVLSRAPRPIHLLSRGDVEQKAAEVTPGALAAVAGLSPELSVPDARDEGRRRAALAEWLASPKNALTWRSIANRVWHYHFGRGIVDTPNDFGKNGSRPTHPELLDWLATTFVGNEEIGKRGAAGGGNGATGKRGNGGGCGVAGSTISSFPHPPISPTQPGSLKSLHRLIMLSATYRQASGENAAFAPRDADNRYLWRMNRQRLEAEAVRDAVLAVSGKLDLRMGGPGFDLFRFKDDHSPIYDHTAVEKVADPVTFRRTVYRFVVRSVPNPFLDSLDCADPNLNTPVRNTTLTALQALALLNDPFMLKQAEFFAERLRAVSPDPERQADAAYRLTLGRSPSAGERSALATYARKHGLTNACRLLFNTNEFVFID